MATLTFYGVDKFDDGRRVGTPTYYSGNFSEHGWRGDKSPVWDGAFFRFPAVSGITKGSTIDSAKLRLKCSDTNGAGTGSADIHGCDADAQAQIANLDYTAFDAISLTTAKTTVPSQTWLSGSWYEFDVTSAIQEIINRGSWGESVLALKVTNVTDTQGLQYWTFYHGSDYPELVIVTTAYTVWTGVSDAAGAGDASDGMSCSAAVADTAGLGDFSDGTAPKATTSDGIALGDGSDAVSQVGVQADCAAVGDAADAMSCSAPAADTAGMGDAAIPNAEYGSIGSGDNVGAGDATDGMSLSADQADAAGLGDSISGWSLSETATEASGLSDSVAEDREAYDIGTAAIGASDAVDGWVYTKWLEQNASKIETRYQVRLFGGLVYTTLVLPIRSFQARLCSGRPSYLSVVVPGLEYAEEIADRNDLVMVLDKIAIQNGVTVLSEMLVIVYLEAVRVDEGVNSSAITLEGHITQTHEQKFLPLQDVTYVCVDDGKYTIRCAQPDWFLKPGHYATYDGNYILVDSISMYVGIQDRSITAWMEVYE